MIDALAAISQAVLYIAIVLACGTVFAEATLALDAIVVRRLRGVARAGAALVAIASLVGGLILIERLGGEFDEATLSALFVSNVGAALALRVAGAVLLLLAIGDTDDPFANGLRLSYAGLILASFAFSGHGAAEGLSIGLMTCVHVAIASWWVGALIAMLTSQPQDFAALVRRFSKQAVVAIGVLIGAGVVLIAVLIDFERPAFTPYVQLLALKVAIAVTVLALAAYNKFRLTPGVLKGVETAGGALRKVIVGELLLIGGVLIATAVLTTYTSPHE